MDFEVFDKRKSALTNAPRATLQKKGILSLNASAHAMLQTAASVELLYSHSTKTIALKPSSEAHAYAFREVNQATGQVVLSLRAFTNYYEIDTEHRYLIDPIEQDGMLLLPLSGAAVVSESRSQKEIT